MKVNEMRSVLAYMGVEYTLQPHKLGELRFLLSQYEKLEPEKTAEAISAVINKVPPVIPEKYADEDDFIKQRTAHYENESVKTFAKRIEEKLQDAFCNFNNTNNELKRLAKQTWEEELKKHRKIVIEDKRKQTAIVLDTVLPPEFEDMIALAQERENIMMVGPAGAGKTYLAGALAKALGMNFSTQSCSAGISESAFSGWLLPTGEGGNFEHNSVPFLDCYEKGGVFLFDEFDASDPNTLTFLNQALANGGFDLPQRIGNSHVTKHPDFIAIAACNTFGSGADAMYHARNALDAATLDRFKIGLTVIDYDNKVEENLIDMAILYWGRDVRRVINQHNLKRILSTRVMIGATKMFLNQKWSIEKIAEKYFSDWSKEELVLIQREGIFYTTKQSKDIPPLENKKAYKAY